MARTPIENSRNDERSCPGDLSLCDTYHEAYYSLNKNSSSRKYKAETKVEIGGFNFVEIPRSSSGPRNHRSQI